MANLQCTWYRPFEARSRVWEKTVNKSHSMSNWIKGDNYQTLHLTGDAEGHLWPWGNWCKMTTPLGYVLCFRLLCESWYLLYKRSEMTVSATPATNGKARTSRSGRAGKWKSNLLKIILVLALVHTKNLKIRSISRESIMDPPLKSTFPKSPRPKPLKMGVNEVEPSLAC